MDMLLIIIKTKKWKDLKGDGGEGLICCDSSYDALLTFEVL